MEHYLASHAEQLRRAWVKRFAPRLWTVDFPRPMMAAATVPAPDVVRVDLDFLTRSDLAGLIWTSEDRWSHPLLAYRTQRDYRGTALAFDWVAGPGVMPLDALNGPVLTIEGRDAQGLERFWFVRLWNYAEGAPMAARIVLDFDDVRAGFGKGGEPVFTGDIDRMFISLVPDGFDGSGLALPAALESFVELRNIVADGPGSTIAIGDAFLPEHRLRICSAYDDSYNQSPERLVEQWQALGYRGFVNHYVGMSHYYALAHIGEGRFEVAGGICVSAKAWHRALARALTAEGMELILSLSFELFDDNAPGSWAQRDWRGARALTGWTPPSTLLSPCNTAAMAWLQDIAADFCLIAADEGLSVRFQVGEPWWWVGPGGAPCFYDAATVALWTGERGVAPPFMRDVIGPRSTGEQDYLDWLGNRLFDATSSLRSAAAAVAAARPFTSYLLFYAPQVLDSATPDLRRANMPSGWAYPDWDVLQLEDYTFVVGGDESGSRRGREAVSTILGYPIAKQQYFSGFVLDPLFANIEWPRIGDAAADAFSRGIPEVLVWAWPQVARDGFQWIDPAGNAGREEYDVDSFHDVRFPLELGFEAVGGPEFATQVATVSSGHEQRNVQWAQARISYDAGLGVRSDADLVTLLGFFRARRGQAFAFRFRDPLDWRSGDLGTPITAEDQLLGTGDGLRLSFPLVKRYGFTGAEEVRRITRPASGTVLVSVGGAVLQAGWNLLPGGNVQFDAAPAIGADVRAGFEFDVPVRFAADRLDISLSGWRAGEIPSVPLVEVRE
ncbi:MAG: DUF2460 domain-containing protein [Sandarakinorhabdus sp.]|nr:DUF2460 domain-containing protein [Sandarakinorhabdus sp.]